MIEQWIVQNNSGAPVEPNSRIGVTCILTLVCESKTYVALVKERYGPPNFKFITGCVDGIDPEQTIRKEIQEEIGLDIGKSEATLYDTIYVANSRPDWNCDPIQDLCLIYVINLGKVENW